VSAGIGIGEVSEGEVASQRARREIGGT
jgi:hypothetical protein